MCAQQGCAKQNRANVPFVGIQMYVLSKTLNAEISRYHSKQIYFCSKSDAPLNSNFRHQPRPPTQPPNVYFALTVKSRNKVILKRVYWSFGIGLFELMQWPSSQRRRQIKLNSSSLVSVNYLIILMSWQTREISTNKVQSHILELAFSLNLFAQCHLIFIYNMHDKLITDLETLIAMPAQIRHYEQIEKR